MVAWNKVYCSPDTERQEQATPIYIVPEEGFDMWLETNAIEHLLFTKANGFKGQKGKVLISADAVFVGAGDGRDQMILGAAAAMLPEGDYFIANTQDDNAAMLAVLGWAFGAYRFEKYIKEKTAPVLILPNNVDREQIGRAVEAVWLARDLVNTPTEDMGPDALAGVVKKVATRFKAQLKVIEGEVLLKQNFPLVHTVGRAAKKAPRLIDMTWGAKNAPKITIVGKGVCFDTGGLNIKGGAGMRLMKKDMGGAANALALALMIMSAELNVRLRLIIPAVENAIDGQAYRPGDVYPSRQGMSVEISNTDAEGRLVLADGLTLGAEEEPDHILSFATLTGAARVALGPELAPIYSTDDGFVRQVQEAAEHVQDPVWHMPFWAGYESYLSSTIADVNHAAEGSFAGSITAALFLKKFVPDNIPYTHFDIFAWNPADRPAHPKGGEAFAIRAVFEVLASTYG